MNGNKGQRGGAQPGAGRKRIWLDIDGKKPHLSSLRVPDAVAEKTQLAALLLDRKDPRIIAFFKSLEKDTPMEKS